MDKPENKPKTEGRFVVELVLVENCLPGPMDKRIQRALEREFINDAIKIQVSDHTVEPDLLAIKHNELFDTIMRCATKIYVRWLWSIPFLTRKISRQKAMTYAVTEAFTMADEVAEVINVKRKEP